MTLLQVAAAYKLIKPIIQQSFRQVGVVFTFRDTARKGLVTQLAVAQRLIELGFGDVTLTAKPELTILHISSQSA